MAITAAMVKELREMTGAGMMDCKKALTNTDGDMDAAVEFLRENGLAKAAKKAGRIAAEGLVAVAVSEDAKEAAIVEVNSETDFVAKNDTFRTYVAEVADQALTTKAADIEGFLAEESKAEAGKTVKEALDGKIAVIGENLNIRRFAKVSAADGFVASYIHAGGKIGVLVEVATDVVNDEIKEMAKNVAMQVAAISPKYTSRDEDRPFHRKEAHRHPSFRHSGCADTAGCPIPQRYNPQRWDGSWRKYPRSARPQSAEHSFLRRPPGRRPHTPGRRQSR